MPKSSRKHDRNIRENTVFSDSASPMPDTLSARLSFSSLALFFLLYIALPSFTLAVFLLLRIGTPQLAYWASMAILAGMLFHNRNTLRIRDYLVFFGILVACHIYAYCSIDLSTDGLAYHQPAIRRIASGFNPISDGYMHLDRSPDVWSDQATYFPKALWYFSAAITAALGDIQFGKVYNPLLMLAALFFVLDANKKEPVVYRALWVVACLNPVALTQMPHTIMDGALSSLVTISVYYAYLFFTGKPISRLQHAFCIVALAMLFCVKASGFGYGCIVIFFIVMHGMVKKYREDPAPSAVKRFSTACAAALQQSLRLGAPVFLLVLVWGFAPYATNILDGKNIFYPLIYDGSERSGYVQTDTEKGAKAVYPDADNRVTRLLLSIAAHTTLDNTQAAKIKNPLDISLADWKDFGQSYHVRAAGLGPLFCLFLLLSVPVLLIFRLRGNGWLLCMLLALIFVQPYSWLMRFAPFLWIFPLACLLSLPEKRRILLWLPLSVAIINVLGVSYFAIGHAWVYSNGIRQICAHFAGEVVMLPQTIYEYAGVFDRYGIRQKYVNPEDTDLASHAQGVGWGRMTGPRLPNGVNIFLKRDLSPLPETTLVFSGKAALPWLVMSDGLKPSGQPGAPNTKWLSNGDKVKFYMAMDKEPKGDWELTLRGSMFGDWRSARQHLDVLLYLNNREIGTWRIDRIDTDTRSVTVTIPRALLAESFADETRLVTLMLRLQGVPPFFRQGPVYGLQLEEMRIRPKALPKE